MFTQIRRWAARGTTRTTPGTPAVALLEALEGRTLFAVTPAPLPAVDAAGVLQVMGTNKSDVIEVSLDAAMGKVNVTVNGTLTQVDLATVTGGVVVTGGNGNDAVTVVDDPAAVAFLDVTMFGGNGKDTLRGGGGMDVLDGGNGKDDLDGGAGDDTLDGGNGKDRVAGGAGLDHFLANDNGKELADFDDAEDTSDLGDLLDQTGGNGGGKKPK